MSFIATWFTPSSIFIIVNLVIGTIALASRFNGPPKNDQQPQLSRSPSLLNRIRSFNLRHCNNHNHQDQEPSFVAQPELESESEFTHPQLVRKPSLLERVLSFNLNKHEPQYPQTHYVQPESESESTQPQLVRKPSLLQRVMSFNLNKHDEAENPVCDEVKSKVEMKKSASEKTLEREEEDEETVERRRPATAAARSETTTCKEDEAVDAKADDFINRFKKQLRLQRLDSFMRYRNTHHVM